MKRRLTLKVSLKKEMAKRGRKTKLTSSIVEKICNGVRLGFTYEHAAQLAGVGYSTFNAWKKKGETAKSGQFREFREAIKRATDRFSHGLKVGKIKILTHTQRKVFLRSFAQRLILALIFDFKRGISIQFSYGLKG